MNRRTLLRSALASPIVLLAGPAVADLPKVESLADALRWLDRVEASPAARSTGQWPLIAVLEHLAQSIEMSVDGFPQPKSALFQNTAGAAAFTFFSLRGRMSHSLNEPIPGAPALSRDGDWHAGASRLRAAIARFNATRGEMLRPHFAYGKLGKSDYAMAHAFHIANHQDEIVLTPPA